MKRTIYRWTLALTALIASTGLSAQTGPLSLTGRLVDPEGRGVAYATVVLVSNADSTRVFGQTSGEGGKFTLKAPRGEYVFRASYLGYTPVSQAVSLTQSADLGDLMLTPSATEIDAVEVRGEMVTREADRFVVDVANSPVAVGKTAKEMLELSPAVWVDEKTGISVNGKGGTQIMVNERIIRETGEDLINYLKTIKAEDIVRIEVIPVGGVEFDASAQGGVIKITLKRQRDNGLDGSVSMRYMTTLMKSRPMQNYSPSFTLNYKVNKLSLYSNVNYSGGNQSSTESSWRKGTTGYDNASQIASSWDWNWLSVRTGGIYDINDKHSVGVEANLNGFIPGGGESMNAEENTGPGGYRQDILSHYDQKSLYRTWGVSANYVAKLDTVGSTFKLLLDYVNTTPRNTGDYYNLYDTNGVEKDSVYRSLSQSWNNLYSVTGDFNIQAGKSGKVKAGFKYMFSDIDSYQGYDYRRNNEWKKIDDRTHTTLYKEHIPALYGDYSYKFANKMTLSAGIRLEYTYAVPGADDVGQFSIDKQNYLSFFPNANLAMPLDKKENHQLILSYARKIRRPNVWNLIPRRWTESETVAYEGNPKLDPCYSNEMSLSWVIKKKYNVTAGAYLMTDDYTWVPTQDADNPNLVVYTPMNQDNRNLYYLTVNLPVNPTKWWTMNANLSGRLTWYTMQGGEQLTNHRVSGNLNNTFTVTKTTSLTLGFRGQTPSKFGYTQYPGFWMVNAGVAQKFYKNKFTANLQFDNIFNSTNGRQITDAPFYYGESFGLWGRPSMSVSLRYNFKSGKEFRAKTVESGADASRISGGRGE